MVWDTDMIASDQSIQVVYKGAALESGTRYFWRVKVLDNHNNVSAWSETAFWEMGLLKPTDWKAQWIEVPWEEDKNTSQPVQMLRKGFALKGPVRVSPLVCHSNGFV
jgi:alpha-L-rhamnosidase